jgi:hypothetical protein
MSSPQAALHACAKSSPMPVALPEMTVSFGLRARPGAPYQLCRASRKEVVEPEKYGPRTGTSPPR